MKTTQQIRTLAQILDLVPGQWGESDSIQAVFT